ncbi:glycolate oxidase subunit GlcE [Motiliproteus sp. MSK22-1]|uniref:glycolate oxidase subunit GlcE n=1 Tax=Motiliproteus sp. MSK22-1 TaxID=1897630 RepID=UPI00097581F6|nr:glycolate oxidase subunit GlcE [Motiliproteus sp. MSK22-1]OMH39232.1 glycolate oxidase subunit GlcE [Motiliproteus sp. MSK22-1]
MADISEELIEQVHHARNAKSPLNIIGGGSKRFYGRDIRGAALSMTEHRGVVSYQPVELVLTARAGTPLVEIEALLNEHQQMLSFEPPLFEGRATLGGTLACNFSGPVRPWGGSVRDQVLGIRLINGKAEHLRFGGQVMKNVAGYDVTRLQAGALGAFGIITEISLKVLPRPAATATLVQEVTMAQAINLMNQRSRESRPLSGACWTDGKLYLRLSGTERAVEGTLKLWSGEELHNADQFWQKLREQKLPFFNSKSELKRLDESAGRLSAGEPLWRFTVKPSSSEILPAGDWLIDWGGAQRWLRGNYDMQELEILAEAAQGQVSCYRGGNRQIDTFHRQPEVLQLIQKRLKAAFDPEGLFNPGRLYSWL